MLISKNKEQKQFSFEMNISKEEYDAKEMM